MELTEIQLNDVQTSRDFPKCDECAAFFLQNEIENQRVEQLANELNRLNELGARRIAKWIDTELRHCEKRAEVLRDLRIKHIAVEHPDLVERDSKIVDPRDDFQGKEEAIAEVKRLFRELALNIGALGGWLSREGMQ